MKSIRHPFQRDLNPPGEDIRDLARLCETNFEVMPQELSQNINKDQLNIGDRFVEVIRPKTQNKIPWI